ncbi:hypothetical protein GGP41_009383 [Bipolaris sorokiniana]|uniref:Uncharacterized protein n=1 Tax=Cochliobolus sativus TaxID=45130 RepID=A0A8H6DRC0_COCSA|nr:hypothetical protein GGP41_009383 [Bipolaris sorokiniana]
MELTGLVASGSSYLERSSRPLADQTCVYNITTHIAESLVVASITECKAPHKLPLGYIYEGLEDMELEEAICCKDIDPPQQHARWFSTVAINQAFSYFVYEYGCVCTGEASVFLRISDDPETVYYLLSVPKGDVGESTG